MTDFDWKGLVSTVAPTIATALGGPLAGMATKAIGAAILGDADASVGDIAKAVMGATPEQLAALKNAENDFVVRMRELDVDVYKIDQQDRNGARDLQKATNSFVVPLLAVLTVGGFFAVIAFVLTGKVPMDSTITGMVIGAVGSKAEQVYNFFFGSSAGSKRKTEHLSGRNQ